MIEDCIDYAKQLRFEFKDANDIKKATFTFIF